MTESWKLGVGILQNHGDTDSKSCNPVFSSTRNLLEDNRTIRKKSEPNPCSEIFSSEEGLQG